MAFPRPAHLSIHDVAPHTLERVGELIEFLAGHGHGRVLLLVIPGLDWSEGDLTRLREWVDAGHLLAGHGWRHHVERYGNWRHALHGWLFSRDVAEHLALNREEVCALVADCAGWFADHGFETPVHYVPPAWAMGPLLREDMRALPFRTYETFRGTYDSERDRFVPGPLVGFEADTALRAVVCRAFNAWNRRRAGREDAPLRISLHPQDLYLRLRDDLERCCGMGPTTADPLALVGEGPA